MVAPCAAHEAKLICQNDRIARFESEHFNRRLPAWLLGYSKHFNGERVCSRRADLKRRQLEKETRCRRVKRI